MRSSLPLRLLVPASLVLLVGTLAALQYRWLGQVGEAERERRQKSLAQRSSEFADDFDREILRLYLALQVDGSRIDRGDVETFARSYDAWRESARYPEILHAVYLADGDAPADAPRKYNPDTRTFEPAPWPANLAPAIDRLNRATASRVSQPQATTAPSAQAQALDQLRHIVAARDPIVSSVPALIVSLPSIVPLPSGSPVFETQTGHTCVVAELDGGYIANTILPALADRYFPERDSDSYRFEVVDLSDRNRTIFARGVTSGASIDPRRADAMVPIFGLRPDMTSQVATRQWFAQSTIATQAPGAAKLNVIERSTGSRGIDTGSVSILVQSRDAAGNDLVRFGSSSAAWQLRFQHAAGSLDAAVSAVRRRNLWLNFGILAVLAAAVMLVVFNAQRSQRLAAQQMDFVAAVSHELRTPVTVIRSAAQNLSAGVVHDAEQARQYGDLIETEGRRLTDMVEQVLEYAGLSGNRRPPATRPVDVQELVREAAASASPLAAADNIEITANVPDDLPLVTGDEDAIRRAVQNLVANAMKYGADGRWVGLAASRVTTRGHDEVQIAVSDRGRGIDPEDLSHIFEPFYRGRYAIDRQIHGNGLGLSLVQRIAQAHGGRVTVTSTPGAGSTFTITLPAAARDGAADPAADATRDAPGSAHSSPAH